MAEVVTPEVMAFRKRWVEELRSGNHVQTTGRLMRIVSPIGLPDIKPGKCCLGIACLLIPGLRQQGVWNGSIRFGDDRQESFLPYEVMKALDFLKQNPVVIYRNFKDEVEDNITLAHLNDWGWSFDEIAEVIEALWIEGVEVREVANVTGA